MMNNTKQIVDSVHGGRDLGGLGKVIAATTVVLFMACAVGILIAIAAGAWALARLAWG